MLDAEIVENFLKTEICCPHPCPLRKKHFIQIEYFFIHLKYCKLGSNIGNSKLKKIMFRFIDEMFDFYLKDFDTDDVVYIYENLLKK
jgi:hypothetical protein